MDWTQVTDDPLDPEVRGSIEAYIKRISAVVDASLESYFSDAAAGRSVLHVGCCEHAAKYMQAAGWKHRSMAERADRLLGVDINEPAVSAMRELGYEVVCADATSDTDLGERFDRVIIGDVIEHVGDLEGLLAFSARHIKADGEIVISTPNPFFARHVLTAWFRRPMIANFEHVSWVTESNMLELTRRAGLTLKAIHYPVGNSHRSGTKKLIKNLGYKIIGTALFTTNIYLVGGNQERG